MADSATFSANTYLSGREAFLGSLWGATVSGVYGRYMLTTMAVPAAGSDPVYSSPFTVNKDSWTLQVRARNIASTTSKIYIDLQYTYDYIHWFTLPEALFRISLALGSTNDITFSILTSLLPGIAYRIKHDPDGGSPALGGTVYLEVFQFQY